MATIKQERIVGTEPKDQALHRHRVVQIHQVDGQRIGLLPDGHAEHARSQSPGALHEAHPVTFANRRP